MLLNIHYYIHISLDFYLDIPPFYQLLEIYHNICKNLDNRLSSIIIFCDISKAFDRVWHKALIKNYIPMVSLVISYTG
jgi:hypothetical protein